MQMPLPKEAKEALEKTAGMAKAIRSALETLVELGRARAT